MADINVERKSPSIWPWIVGLLVLALLIWAIAEMVDRGDAQLETAQETETEVVPSAVPAPGAVTEVRTLEELAPLGSDDVGQMVRFSAQVIGQPGTDGFWVRTRSGEMIYVVSSRTIQPDQQIEIQGIIERSAPDEATGRIDRAQLRQHPEFDATRVHTEVHVSESGTASQPRP
ncbi:MAG TPA: hypothetical protein VNZ57_12790 [Longimicrobiales bacterium]|nr:hypothetical protein [Longimicrobiales bacterium]